MKLGFLTAPFPETPLMDVADWAAANDFQVLEIACWPRASGPDPALCRHVATSTSRTCRPAEAKEIVGRARGQGPRHLRASASIPTRCTPIREVRRAAIDHIKKVIEAAAQMGVPFMNTFMGGDPRKNLDENWEDALKIWPEIVKHAQDNGVRVTIENCPMIFSDDEWPGGNNIAWSPYIWRRILEQWGGTVGLNYDPSHLVWLMIDQGRFIREFGPHIFHFQAKDVQIDRDGLYERGVAVRGASAGRSRACPAWATPTGARSSPTSIASATTATASSSTRIAASRGPTSWSSAASCWRATSSARTSRRVADERPMTGPSTSPR